MKAKVLGMAARLDDQRRVIGAILIDEGHLNCNEADAVDKYASETGLRFGEAAIKLKLVSDADVNSALALQFNHPILARGGDLGVADDLVAAYNPQAAIVEPLRALRGQLSLRWVSQEPRKALAITSLNRGDGRSWIAANLAVVFAQSGSRTLLIDTDMRHPSQHRLFNVDNSLGLSALLTGRALGHDVIRRLHPSLRLFVLPAGIVPPNPGELIMRPIFNELLLRLAKMFAVVILDTPAALETADAQILAARAGAAVVLVRRNRTRVAELTAMTAGLADTGARVIGCVSNDR